MSNPNATKMFNAVMDAATEKVQDADGNFSNPADREFGDVVQIASGAFLHSGAITTLFENAVRQRGDRGKAAVSRAQTVTQNACDILSRHPDLLEQWMKSQTNYVRYGMFFALRNPRLKGAVDRASAELGQIAAGQMLSDEVLQNDWPSSHWRKMMLSLLSKKGMIADTVVELGGGVRPDTHALRDSGHRAVSVDVFLTPRNDSDALKLDINNEETFDKIRETAGENVDVFSAFTLNYLNHGPLFSRIASLQQSGNRLITCNRPFYGAVQHFSEDGKVADNKDLMGHLRRAGYALESAHSMFGPLSAIECINSLSTTPIFVVARKK